MDSNICTTRIHSNAKLGECGFEGVSLPRSLAELDCQVQALESRCPVLSTPWPSSLRVLALWVSDPHLLEQVCRQLPSTLWWRAVTGCQADVLDVQRWLGRDDSVSAC
eukprot:TRINITY_DN81097_c0_g1_i1.p3 TRINITY_DN81097_c0_g1~~TRINITY_DN81097_c0_g1_i1.p3  ORF type:complete len:108 (+),score=6.89 TRINITY_DN81097_c0_g1_i1:1-324(+)